MQKNDFRRAFIVLRALRRGMSGHVRLERRTGQASMRFTVQGRGRGTLRALLLARRGREYLAHPLGTLSTDSRGQGTLLASFDPRNLGGMDLDQAELVVVVDDAGPEMVLSGMVNGSKEVDWTAAQRAATALFRQQEAPAPETAQAAPREEKEDQGAISPPVAPQSCAIVSPPQEPAGAPASAPQAQAETHAEIPKAQAEPPQAQAEMPQAQAEPPQAQADMPKVQEEKPQAQEAAPQAAEDAPAPPTACERLGIAPDAAWPREIAALKALFESSAPTQDFALEDFVFVEAPLPADDGAQGRCAIGLRAENGQAVSVCYAIPGSYAPTPPPGLEGYQYLGGWWYTVLEAQPERNARGEAIAP